MTPQAPVPVVIAAPVDAIEPERTFSAAQIAALEPEIRDVIDGHHVFAALDVLRMAGPVGLKAVVLALDEERKISPNSDRVSRLEEAADRVARQRHASVSHLYWYTDLEAAKVAAKEEHKLIVSLRLLGDLGDELSCANSRFFRVALYADTRLSHYLQNHFVLHWSSERPAPKITVDYGDGRVLVRTITGNSLHYILDPEGNPIDALPGLYGAWGFQRHLHEVDTMVRGFPSILAANPSQPHGQASAIVTSYNEQALSRIQWLWASEYTAIGGNPAYVKAGVMSDIATPAAPATPASPASAFDAMQVGYGKGVVETALLHAILPEPTSPVLDTIPWLELARYHREEGRLDSQSRALMRAKNPFTWSESGHPEPMTDAAFERLANGFEQVLAIESIRNEIRLHAPIHRWLAEPDGAADLRALNRRVYTELFKTPATDPWLGLVPSDTYSAVDNNGISQR